MATEIVKRENADLLPALMKEVEDKIVVIRNQEVIADADVAALYGVETREVNQAVKNNQDKFPIHYMFELSSSELRDLKSKILISKVSKNSRRSSTKAFTERGLYIPLILCLSRISPGQVHGLQFEICRA